MFMLLSFLPLELRLPMLSNLYEAASKHSGSKSKFLLDQVSCSFGISTFIFRDKNPETKPSMSFLECEASLKHCY